MKFPDLPKWQMIAVPAMLLCLALFYIARYVVADELIYANDHITALESDLGEALEALASEQARSAVMEREIDVLRRANALLRESEGARQDEIAELRADLAFYRRLGGASGSQAPLAVHYLELQPTQSPQVYRLIFTLTQNLRWAAVISGRVELGLDGIQDGSARHLGGEQLLPEAAQPVEFRFKYFQQLERLLTLPEGFEPSRLTIRLVAAGLNQPVERAGDWSGLFNREASGADPGDIDDRADGGV
jgi:hypothetical protein